MHHRALLKCCPPLSLFLKEPSLTHCLSECLMWRLMLRRMSLNVGYKSKWMSVKRRSVWGYLTFCILFRISPFTTAVPMRKTILISLIHPNTFRIIWERIRVGPNEQFHLETHGLYLIQTNLSERHLWIRPYIKKCCYKVCVCGGSFTVAKNMLWEAQVRVDQECAIKVKRYRSRQVDSGGMFCPTLSVLGDEDGAWHWRILRPRELKTGCKRSALQVTVGQDFVDNVRVQSPSKKNQAVPLWSHSSPIFFPAETKAQRQGALSPVPLAALH